MGMGRKRTKNKDLPHRVYLSRGWYFYVPKIGKQHKLAKEGDKAGMHRQLAVVLSNAKPGTYAVLFDEFERQYLQDKAPDKLTKDDYAPETIKGYKRQLKTLRAWCGNMALGTVTKTMIGLYLDNRAAKVLANREIALFSEVCIKGVRWGFLTDNPCDGVERNPEAPRRHVIADVDLARAYVAAKPWMRALMRMAYVSGQRRRDVMKFKQTNFGREGLTLTQGKTGKTLLLQWTDGLRYAYRFALEQRKTTSISGPMFCNSFGGPITEITFRREWERVQAIVAKEGERFQFRDIRAGSGTAHETGEHLGNTPAVREKHYRLGPKKLKPL